jgi:thioredoxin-related protein
MKLISSLLFLYFFNLSAHWNTDFEKAKTEATQSHKLIILNFSGSDWCAPCIRTKEEIFESSAFQNYAEQNLVLVNADFPRLRKNQLSKEQTKRNEALADKYNPDGKFPLTILFDETGKILARWEGYPNESPEKFIQQINAFAHAAR